MQTHLFAPRRQKYTEYYSGDRTGRWGGDENKMVGIGTKYFTVSSSSVPSLQRM